MRSLKQRLTVWVVAAAVGLTAVAGVSLYLISRAYLIRQFDGALERKARLLLSSIVYDGRDLELEFEDLNLGEFELEEGGGYLHVLLDGEVLYRSRSSGVVGLPSAGVALGGDWVGWVDMPAGRRGRAVLHSFVPRGGGTGQGAMLVTLCVARDAREVTVALGALQIGLAGVGVVFASVMSLVAAYGVGRGLRPIDDLAEAVGAVDEQTLGVQVGVSGLPAELRPIVDQFNGLSERLRVAFERERCFSADVAHELRTPLSGLRTTIEVALARDRGGEEYVSCLERLGGVTVQMQALVEGLLRLAALEGGRVVVKSERVRVDEVVDDAWQEVSGDGELDKVFDAQLSLESGATVVTDSGLLSVILRNVMRNAVCYVDGGGSVKIATRVVDGSVELRVTNSGSHVARGDAERVFDRFWRADPSRSERAGSSFGLGLAVARQVASAISGVISAASQEGGQFEITLRLPLEGGSIQ